MLVEETFSRLINLIVDYWDQCIFHTLVFSHTKVEFLKYTQNSKRNKNTNNIENFPFKFPSTDKALKESLIIMILLTKVQDISIWQFIFLYNAFWRIKVIKLWLILEMVFHKSIISHFSIPIFRFLFCLIGSTGFSVTLCFSTRRLHSRFSIRIKFIEFFHFRNKTKFSCDFVKQNNDGKKLDFLLEIGVVFVD